MKPIDVLRIAESRAEFMRLVACYVDDNRSTDNLLHVIGYAFDEAVSELRQRALIIESQSPTVLSAGSSHPIRKAIRSRSIHSWTAYGNGCDCCCDERVQRATNLHIGTARASLSVSLCRLCAERVSAVVDARLNDKRMKAQQHQPVDAQKGKQP